MADEEIKTEEVVDEKVETEEKVDATDTDDSGEKELLDDMTKFDKLVSEEENPADDDGDEEPAKEETPAKEEAVVEKTEAKNDDSELEAEMKAIEADDQKKADEVVTDKVVEPVKKVEPEKKVDEPAKFVSDLDPEEWDKDAIERDTKQGQKHLDELNAEKDKNARLTARLDQADVERQTDWVDKKFSGLSDDFTEVFGDGDFDDLTPGSEEHDNRVKIIKRMNLIGQAHQNTKKAVPSRNNLFKMAVEREFKEIINKSSKEKDTTKKLAARKKQVIGKGSKKAAALSAEDRLNKVQSDFDRKAKEDD